AQARRPRARARRRRARRRRRSWAERSLQVEASVGWVHDGAVSEGTAVEAPAGGSELLERERELETLAACLDNVRSDSRGRVVVVSGEAGVGKTALLRRFREDSRGVRVLWGGCDPLFTPRPLGPLVAVADAVGGPLAETLQRDPAPHEVVSALVEELQG